MGEETSKLGKIGKLLNIMSSPTLVIEKDPPMTRTRSTWIRDAPHPHATFLGGGSQKGTNELPSILAKCAIISPCPMVCY